MAKSAVEALLDSAGPAPAVTTAEDEFKPPLPKTKGEVGKLSSEQMDTLVEVHGLAMPGEWHEASAAEKHKLMNVALGFVASKKGKGAAPSGNVVAPAAPAAEGETLPWEDQGPVDLTPKHGQGKAVEIKKGKVVAPAEELDPIAKTAQDIEQLTKQDDVEAEISAHLKSEGLNDFRLGGLLLRLLEIGTFGDNTAFKDYISGKWGLKYRKARYLIELYTGLLKAGVPWDTVAGIGWSKVITLLPVLTAENATEWVDKAVAYNNDTLQAAVQASLSSGEAVPQAATMEASKLKTLTFNVGPDQEDLIKEAVEDAMKKGQTEHKGVALELICTEYLGNNSGMKAKKPEGDYVTVASHQQTLKTVVAEVLKPKSIFTHFLEQAGGDKAAALGALFGPEFDEVFPGAYVEIEFK